MVIKVVGQDDSAIKRKTCRQCGAINEYHPIDVKVLYSGRDIGGGSDGRKGFKCGQCSSEVVTEAW
jgi:hypothetical protein